MSKRINIEDSEASSAPNHQAEWKATITSYHETQTCPDCKQVLPIDAFAVRRYRRKVWFHTLCLPCWEKNNRRKHKADELEMATALHNINKRRKKIHGQAKADGHSGKFKGATSK